MPKSPYGGAWPRIRAAVLERDGYVCKIRGATCTLAATCVDHIVPVDDGGAWWDMANLRAACRSCNNARRAPSGSRRWRSAHTAITLVVGGTADERTAYVRRAAVDGDLVVDLPSLVASTGGDEVAQVTYDAMVERLLAGRIPSPRAWITSGEPMAGAVLPHHHLVDLSIYTGDGQPGRGGPGVSTSTNITGRPGSGAAVAASASREW